MSAARTTYLREDCTASDFLERGYIVTSLAQKGILRRVTDYSLCCRMWIDAFPCRQIAVWADHQRCNDLARMTATLAFLAFPDLRDKKQMEVAA